MISEREIKRRYAELMRDVAENPYFTMERAKVNCYVCEKCRQIIKTIDVDTGTTPFMISCDKCNGMAQSKMYHDVAPNMKPTYEWFRPTLKQCLKMKHKQQLLEHVLVGGLDRRKIEPNIVFEEIAPGKINELSAKIDKLIELEIENLNKDIFDRIKKFKVYTGHEVNRIDLVKIESVVPGEPMLTIKVDCGIYID